MVGANAVASTTIATPSNKHVPTATVLSTKIATADGEKDGMVGRRVRKCFGSRAFWGTVASLYPIHGAKFYKIKFDDGDVDILSEEEVQFDVSNAAKFADDDVIGKAKQKASCNCSYSDLIVKDGSSLKRKRDEERQTTPSTQPVVDRTASTSTPGRPRQAAASPSTVSTSTSTTDPTSVIVTLQGRRLFASIIASHGAIRLHEFIKPPPGQIGELEAGGHVKVGDILIAVNGKTVAKMSSQQVSDIIRKASRPIVLTFQPQRHHSDDRRQEPSSNPTSARQSNVSNRSHNLAQSQSISAAPVAHQQVKSSSSRNNLGSTTSAPRPTASVESHRQAHPLYGSQSATRGPGYQQQPVAASTHQGPYMPTPAESSVPVSQSSLMVRPQYDSVRHRRANQASSHSSAVNPQQPSHPAQWTPYGYAHAPSVLHPEYAAHAIHHQQQHHVHHVPPPQPQNSQTLHHGHTNRPPTPSHAPQPPPIASQPSAALSASTPSRPPSHPQQPTQPCSSSASARVVPEPETQASRQAATTSVSSTQASPTNQNTHDDHVKSDKAPAAAPKPPSTAASASSPKESSEKSRNKSSPKDSARKSNNNQEVIDLSADTRNDEPAIVAALASADITATSASDASFLSRNKSTFLTQIADLPNEQRSSYFRPSGTPSSFHTSGGDYAVVYIRKDRLYVTLGPLGARVAITSFVRDEHGGKGEIEDSGKVLVGDILVAINGAPITPYTPPSNVARALLSLQRPFHLYFQRATWDMLESRPSSW